MRVGNHFCSCIKNNNIILVSNKQSLTQVQVAGSSPALVNLYLFIQIYKQSFV